VILTHYNPKTEFSGGYERGTKRRTIKMDVITIRTEARTMRTLREPPYNAITCIERNPAHFDEQCRYEIREILTAYDRVNKGPHNLIESMKYFAPTKYSFHQGLEIA
jgi:hypothetical protein